ncbi:TetR/AcrR family transcriptional regulator [Lacisediminihabitans sp.]|uniref:TetR/AcrR family transcriptional regulator n=1 Tax=Lacisediminihabitans sp. TaxID=2787631 RepID=UPI00374D8603
MADPVEYGLPSGVALAWGVAERPQRGPRRELSIERIVEAAIGIADSEGLGAVSMARVANSLEFTTMSLYRYLTSKDDLLVLMQDAVGAEAIPGPVGEQGWRDALRSWVAQVVNVYQAHPWFGEIPVSGVPLTPNSLGLVDWALEALRDVGMSEQDKMSSILLLSGYATNVGRITGGFARAKKAGATTGTITGASYVDALRELVSEERFPSLYPLVQSGVYTDEETDSFAFGLETLLDGIEGHLESGGPPTPVAAVEPYPTRDKAVREATKARREAAARLRDLRKREAELVAKARERDAAAAKADSESL